MSFKEISSDVALINRALAAVAETKTISSVNDAGFNAQVARRWYKPTVARLLEMHHWGLATKRLSLPEVTNNRSNEWLYAYSAPDDMAFPIGVITSSGSSNISYYRGLSGLVAMAYGKPVFQFHNGIIYSNWVGELEYVSFDITEANFNAAFENIVVLMLASRFALEIPKDFDLSKELADQAMTEINIAITQNLNTGQRTYGNTVSEAELARGAHHGSWDYIPLSPGA